VHQDRKSARGVHAVVLTLMILIALTITWGQSSTRLDAASRGEVSLPLSWPLPVPSTTQVQRARDCNIQDLVAERYPFSIRMEDFSSTFTPQTACDWAALSVAYASRTGEDEPPPPEGRAAFARAISLNSAYAFASPVLFAYFGVPTFVEAPPVTQQPITQVALNYAWSGLGDEVAYDVTISAADTEPVASGTVNGEPYQGHPPLDIVRGFGVALTDLVPIEKPLSLIVCHDNYPDWHVSLTYADGTQLELVTNGSNVFNAGGPWQVTVDGQHYMQYSPIFMIALAEVVEVMGLPWGQPAGMYCSGLEDSLLNLAFP
jgi:hypothetical protein